MCAINPKHEKHFTISAYTSQDIPEKEFQEAVALTLLYVEIKLNESGRLRWHIQEDTRSNVHAAREKDK
jgi:hypothetical protein